MNKVVIDNLNEGDWYSYDRGMNNIYVLHLKRTRYNEYSYEGINLSTGSGYLASGFDEVYPVPIEHKMKILSNVPKPE